MSKITPALSKIWLKIKNIENSLFPDLQENLGRLSPKEQKLIKILDLAEIEKSVYTTIINQKRCYNDCSSKNKLSSFT